MGQQPNIELEIADLPRPTPHPAPARRWKPGRPAELTDPGRVPWGGLYGTPGPDTGFVIRLVRRAAVAVPDGEERHDVEAALAAIAAARASRFGRAPVPDDVRVAAIVLGLEPAGVPEAIVEGLRLDRAGWLAGIAHAPTRLRSLVGGVPVDVLVDRPDRLLARLAGGERLVAR